MKKASISFFEINVDVLKGALRLREEIDNIDFNATHSTYDNRCVTFVASRRSKFVYVLIQLCIGV